MMMMMISKILTARTRLAGLSSATGIGPTLAIIRHKSNEARAQPSDPCLRLLEFETVSSLMEEIEDRWGAVVCDSIAVSLCGDVGRWHWVVFNPFEVERLQPQHQLRDLPSPTHLEVQLHSPDLRPHGQPSLLYLAVGLGGRNGGLLLRHVFFLPVPEATEGSPFAGAKSLLEDAPRCIGGRVLVGEGSGALWSSEACEGGRRAFFA